MEAKGKKIFIVYCSPAGATRHVAEVIENQAGELGAETVLLDLGTKADSAPVTAQIAAAGENACLFIGSPVYASHAVPPVTDFINGLPEKTGASAVPFVTWGAVTSGIALHDMGKKLGEKGFRLAGAAKVVAPHSMMWRSEDPLGKGHPDADDDRMLREMVAEICKKTGNADFPELSLTELAYQPEAAREQMEKSSLAAAKGHLPKREVDTGLCNECGTCAEVCPVDAITFSPWPEFGDRCICCYNCVRECPETAIKADFSKLEQGIRVKAEKFVEQPLTRIFV
ncbi:4Fe-4S ferredoxin [Desulfonema ishimotonii]|uniref:4Fe-4S ferredoxin n=1 Tax=Desulfonema ishimotonii TaxID=45657 RepID=A0A401FZQ5_9BACT|nr:EFR1 family ferrodoxin [Desulfonema ishimotonii]GBC62472.1 4Fe-4S ferredoxin [Desulfonema ishimotonii]